MTKAIKTIKAVYGAIRSVLTVALVCLLAIIITQRVSNNKAALAGLRIFTVVTESMVPEYLVGDAILVKQENVENLQEGDDITYLGKEESFADRIVTHRIIKKEKNEDGTYTITTKGIANEAADPKITGDQIYGKVIYKIKSISYINGIIGNLYGMYFVFIVPMAIMIFFEFMVKRKEDDEEDDDEEMNEEEKENIRQGVIEKLEKMDEKKSKRRKRRSKRREKRKIKEQM